jgi:ribonuclease BN (tRNA processing enzyme)
MKEKTKAFEIVFYGTSGWFDNESGATSCTGIFANETDLILLDLGTGARKIKKDSVRGKNLTVVLSHLHLDHCYGLHILPLFQPASLTIVIHKSLKPYLETLFSFPFMKPNNELGFPVDIQPVDDSLIDYARFRLKTRALQHNTPVIGAQLQLGNTSIAYCVDSTLCDALLDLTKDCDILITESSPLKGKKTNGFHLSLPELQAVLTATDAKKVIITHFGPLKYPDIKSRELLFASIKECHNNIIMAYDGLIIQS